MASSGEGIVLGGENGWAVAGAANSVWYLEHAALPAVTGETPTVFPSPKEEMDPGAPGSGRSQLDRQRGTRRRCWPLGIGRCGPLSSPHRATR